ncbi:MAG: hypothetical protein WCR21_04760 [Bacteroidota bacterium]
MSSLVSFTNKIFQTKQSHYLAESGIEDSYYRMRVGIPVSGDPITLPEGITSIVVTDTDSSHKKIDTSGLVSGMTRKTELNLLNSNFITFNQGLLADTGGVFMKSTSSVGGNIYSNGSITGVFGAASAGDVYVSGTMGVMYDMNIGAGGAANAHAYKVSGTTVSGTIYCQYGIGNSAPCDTSESLPSVEPLPINDTSITLWKNDAVLGGVIMGDHVVSTLEMLGPKKIVGNLHVVNHGSLSLSGTLWVTGDVIFDGTPDGSSTNLSGIYGSNGGMIIADGKITINPNVALSGSGILGSEIMLLSTLACDETNSSPPCFGNNSITVNSHEVHALLYAKDGTIDFEGSSNFKFANANKIRLKSGVNLNYSAVPEGIFFGGGSSSWVPTLWKEVE